MRVSYKGYYIALPTQKSRIVPEYPLQLTINNNGIAMSLVLSREDALFAANYYKEYFENFERIDDYFRRVKLERMANIPTPLFGMSIGDDMFSDFAMSPQDMEIEVRPADSRYDDYLEVTASHAVEKSAPGRTLKLMLFEKNTNKIIGFIRIGSCTINSRPRNEYLGRPLDTYNPDAMKRFNDASCMGLIIVPTQPFGYNYLGGKLLAGICCTTEVKQMFDERYNSNLCYFETTSLYGSTKSASQYDGMKPILRYKGLTDSDFTPLLNDKKFAYIRDWFALKNGGERLKTKASSVKLSLQTMMIAIIKSSLKKHDEAAYQDFVKVINDAKGLTEKKRVYISDYGFANAREYILGETDTLIKKENYEKHAHENVINWWKKLATKRYDKLKSEGKLRTELELWNENSDIDIIR